jgi:hypothetical protein
VRVLYLVRRPDDELAWEAIRAHPSSDEVRVVLLQDAAQATPPVDVEFAAAADDARARGGPGPGRLIEYDEIVAWMEWSEKVVAW